MSNKELLLNYKHYINERYNEKAFAAGFDYADFNEAGKLIGSYCPTIDSVLEISHFFTPILDYIKCGRKFFLSDDDFESLLAYAHDSGINSYHLPWNASGFETFNQNQQFDLAVSFIGLCYADLFDKMKPILSTLKVGGYYICIVPTYWVDRSSLSDTESTILQYSKQNDKKWLFVEDINPVISDNNCSLVECRKLQTQWITDRRSLAYLIGLTKLYNAEMTGDISILETTTIAKDNLHLNLSALVIRKDKAVLDKNNLFKF